LLDVEWVNAMTEKGDAARRRDRGVSQRELLPRAPKVFHEEDVHALDRALERYQRATGSQSSLLVDLDGHLVTQVGALVGVDAQTLSALLAASFKAAREIARDLGEEEYASLSQLGRDEAVQITLVGERTILATVYSPVATTPGLVSFNLPGLVTEVRRVLETARERPIRPVFETVPAAEETSWLFGDDL
jgi:predicted regulator of Ras-like GTPase activity (Roadblock/LC7/MglB family)